MTALELQNEKLHYYGFGYETMKQVKVCKKCGTLAGIHQLFCKECGAFMQRKSMYDKYKARHSVCRKCKTILPDSSKYCPQCGKSVK